MLPVYDDGCSFAFEHRRGRPPDGTHGKMKTSNSAADKNFSDSSSFFQQIISCSYFERCGTDSGVGRSIIGGGGGNIHIFVFTDLKNNRFQKKLIMQNTNI